MNTIRFAAPDDAAALLRIYAQYIETPITFEYTLPSEEEFARRRNSQVMPESWVRGGWLARYQKLVSSADEGAILRDTL